MDRKTVIVVGAGGTLSDALRTPTAKRPPLDRNFFSKIDPKRQELTTIKQYLTERYNIDPSNQADDSLESIFSILYADSFQVGQVGQDAFRAFRALIRLLIRELADTTNALPASPRDFVFEVIDRLLQSGLLASDIQIITFNYDLHIESDLEILAQSRQDNSIFDFPALYHLKYVECTVPSESDTAKDNCFKRGPGKGGLSLLKLHGSLNWYTKHNSAEVSRRALFKADKKVNVTMRRVILPSMTWSGNGKGRRLHTFPEIIPPVINKAEVMPDVMKPLWQLAADALRQATSVIVIGYSCPHSDHESANMFRRAFRTSSVDKELYIIDPNPNTLMRYVELTNVDSVAYYRSVDQFLRKWGMLGGSEEHLVAPAASD